MGEHDFALELIDEDIAGRMENEPADVLASSAGWVGGNIDVRVRGEIAEGVCDEPLSVAREGAEEDVNVVDPLRYDDTAHRLENVSRWR